MTKEELHNVAPTLSKIKKESSFKIPNTYFDQVEDAVMLKLNIETINQFNVENSFKTPEDYFNSIEEKVLSNVRVHDINFEVANEVPDDYFDTIEDAVFNKINAEKKNTRNKSIKRYVLPLSIAASFLLLIMLFPNNEDVSFDSLAIAEIEEFIDYELIDIDTQSLVNTYADYELDDSEFSSAISEDEVFDYLNDEDLELIIYEN